MVDQVAPSAATARRSFLVQSHISTWKPRSLMRLTRSRYGTSCQNISVVTASGNMGVAMERRFLPGVAGPPFGRRGPAIVYIIGERTPRAAAPSRREGRGGELTR